MFRMLVLVNKNYMLYVEVPCVRDLGAYVKVQVCLGLALLFHQLSMADFK